MTNYCVFSTKQGFVALAGSNGTLTHSTLPRRSAQEALSAIKAGLGADGVEDEAAFGDLPQRIRDYFEGKPVDFSGVKVDFSAFGDFHAAAMRAAQKLPFGTVVTYRDLARMAGRERAARAAGSAMANNPVPLIVPCHRVVAAGWKIGGFGQCLEWKRSLLKLEGVDI